VIGGHVRNWLVVALAAGLLLSSCTTDDSSPDGEGDRTACDTSKGTLVVGVIAPLSGAAAAQGKGVVNSAQLAVDQANKDCAVNGYKLVVQPEDDAGNPDLGAQAATKLAVDAKVVGVVSTVSDAVSTAVQPVLDSATVLQISPGNTADQLSRGADPDKPERPFKTYFRTSVLDSAQGRVAARYLDTAAKKRKIAIVTDGQPYGEMLAFEFGALTEEVTWQRVDPSVRDFSGVIAAITPFSPDAVFFGGDQSQAAALSKQLGAAGLGIPVMGGGSLVADAYLTGGGRDGDLAVAVDGPGESTFDKAYQAAGYPEPAGPYGVNAYDAAKVIIETLATTVGDKKWSVSMRKGLLATADKYEGDGLTGRITFDDFGDTTNRPLAVHQVKAGKWEEVPS
jgi:branched-chain amino acid transport system substrate-binding protein